MEVVNHTPYTGINLENVWSSAVGDNIRQKISFQEHLIVSRLNGDSQSTGTPVGGLCLNIQPGLDDRARFVIFLSSELAVGGHKGGSKITTWLDSDLHTVEEKRTEYLEMDSDTHRHVLYVAMQKGCMFVKYKRTGDEREATKRAYEVEQIRNLVCEGASMTLMRFLAVTKYIGQFETSTLYINGDLCRNLYMCTGPESGIVNGNRMDVCRIYRRVMEKCGIVHTCHTSLTTAGRIIAQEWNGCDYMVHMDPLADPLDPTHHGGVDWRADVQLLSAYLDRKELCLSEVDTYLNDRPEIRNVLSDYVQAVLVAKPADVVAFTMEYFVRYERA